MVPYAFIRYYYRLRVVVARIGKPELAFRRLKPVVGDNVFEDSVVVYKALPTKQNVSKTAFQMVGGEDVIR